MGLRWNRGLEYGFWRLKPGGKGRMWAGMLEKIGKSKGKEMES